MTFCRLKGRGSTTTGNGARELGVGTPLVWLFRLFCRRPLVHLGLALYFISLFAQNFPLKPWKFGRLHRFCLFRFPWFGFYFLFWVQQVLWVTFAPSYPVPEEPLLPGAPGSFIGKRN